MLSLIMIVLVVVVSCKKDDDDDDNNNNNNNNTYSFLNQDLQGMIDGNAWTYTAGTFENSYWDSLEFDIDLFDTTGANITGSICDVFSSSFDYKVMFSCPMQVGLYELNFDWTSGQTITLVDWTADPVNNIICSEGAIEIVSVNDSVLTGKIDARFDAASYINGNFTVTFCN